MTYFSPILERGSHGLSAGATNQLVDAALWQRSRSTAIDQVLSHRAPEITTYWLGKITASTPAVAPHKWIYTVSRHVLKTVPLTAPYSIAHPDLRIQEVTAYNLYELYAHTGFLGDGTDVTHIPTGFAAVPVTGIVMCYSIRSDDATSVFVFDRPNGIDGACP